MKSTVKIWRETKDRYKHLSKMGRVVSWSKIYQPPKDFGSESYIAVMVEVSKNLRVVGQLVGKEIKKGDVVMGVLRRLREQGGSGVIEYGVKWRRV